MFENIKSAFRSLSSGLHWAPPLSGAYCTVNLQVQYEYSYVQYRKVTHCILYTVLVLYK